MTTGNLSLWRQKAAAPCVGGIYVHVPFCKKKCPYCHFAVRTHKDSLVSPYINTIRAEWEHRKELLDEVSTLYFGGGTPSIISSKEFEALFKIFPECKGEITIEANPEDVTLEKMSFLRELGVNRVSIGAQSFSDSRLKAIGRDHTSRDTNQAVEMTLRAGIENISIDLMYDLPNQTFAEWENSVSIAVGLPITHLSLYNMTFEPGALYYKDRHAIKQLMPSSETSTQMLSHAAFSFEAAGLRRYEISAFAKPGFMAQHNTSYWKGLPFIGIGPSAFSYYEGARFRNSSHISKWQLEVEAGKEPVDFEECLPYPQNVHELFVVQLRLLSGVNMDEFNLPEETLHKIDQLVAAGYLKKNHDQVALTTRGTLFYDTVATELI